MIASSLGGEGNKISPPGRVDHSPYMEHHLRGNEGRLLEVDNEPQREVTAETDVVSATCLQEGGLSMEFEDAIYVKGT